jgi:hypothetical protein
MGESVRLDVIEPITSCEHIDVNATFTATGAAGPIAAARVRLDTYKNCDHAADRIADSPWAPFENAISFTIAGGPRVYVAALTAQYRDTAGNLSGVVCDEVLGLCPDAPTATPEAAVQRRKQ